MADTPETATISLHETAERLNVHYMTVYRYVRLGVLPAAKVGRSWRVAVADLEAFQAAPPVGADRGDTDWAERFTNRALSGDEAGAWQVVEAAQASGMGFQDTYRTIIIPSLGRIGSLWEAGEIEVAGEHVASRVIARIIGRLGPKITSRGVRRGTVVLGGTATEQHALPIAIVADLFRGARFDVLDLGPNLPYESFGRTVAAQPNVVAVGISVTTPGQSTELTKTVAAVRTGTDAPIILGGAGVTRDEAAELGADGWARTGDEAVAVVEALIG
jgi:excisionase family DNA binding protein